MKYLFMGKELGGRPDGDEFYDSEGHVLYWRVAESHLFLDGIAESAGSTLRGQTSMTQQFSRKVKI